MASIGTSKASKKPCTKSSRRKRASATPLKSLHRRGFLNPSERWLKVADGKAAAAMTQSGPSDPKGMFFRQKFVASLLHFSHWIQWSFVLSQFFSFHWFPKATEITRQFLHLRFRSPRFGSSFLARLRVPRKALWHFQLCQGQLWSVSTAGKWIS